MQGDEGEGGEDPDPQPAGSHGPAAEWRPPTPGTPGRGSEVTR
jgi:hypothetical protein